MFTEQMFLLSRESMKIHQHHSKPTFRHPSTDSRQTRRRCFPNLCSSLNPLCHSQRTVLPALHKPRRNHFLTGQDNKKSRRTDHRHKVRAWCACLCTHPTTLDQVELLLPRRAPRATGPRRRGKRRILLGAHMEGDEQQHAGKVCPESTTLVWKSPCF